MNRRRKVITKRISVDRINRLVDCPYGMCGSRKGEPCINQYKGKPSSDPHPSRARAAFDKLEAKER